MTLGDVLPTQADRPAGVVDLEDVQYNIEVAMFYVQYNIKVAMFYENELSNLLTFCATLVQSDRGLANSTSYLALLAS